MRIKYIKQVYPGDPLEEEVPHHKINNKSVVSGELYSVGSFNFISTKGMYYPEENDLVIARIFYCSTDFYKCDVNGYIGLLPALSFTNATKRNKPELENNDFVFCKVIKIGSEILLSCVGDKLGKVDGFIGNFPNYKIKKLYLGMINDIGKKYRFKIFLGMNGKVCCSGEEKVVYEVFKFIENIE